MPIVSTNHKTWRTEAIAFRKPADRNNNFLGNFGTIPTICSAVCHSTRSQNAHSQRQFGRNFCGLATVQTFGMQSIESPAQRPKTAIVFGHSTSSHLATFITHIKTDTCHRTSHLQDAAATWHLHRTRQPRDTLAGAPWQGFQCMVHPAQCSLDVAGLLMNCITAR